MTGQTPPDLRAEIDALHAALFSLQVEFGQMRRSVGVNEEEVHRRLVWYSALEQLTIEVGVYLRTGDDTALRDMWMAVKRLHGDVSPAIPRLQLADRLEKPA